MLRNSCRAFIVAVGCFAVSAQAQSNGCKAGYLPREAFAGDSVCVTPAQHKQALADNAAAASRLRDLCIPGYVWRGAQKGDHICVTHEVRAETSEENEQAVSHTLVSTLASETEITQKGRETPPGESSSATKNNAIVPPKGFHFTSKNDFKNDRPRPARRQVEKTEQGARSISSSEVLAQANSLGLGSRAFTSVTMDTAAQINGYTYWAEVYCDAAQGEGLIGAIINTGTFNLQLQGDYACVAVSINANPGQPYMLDCDLGIDQSVSVFVSYYKGSEDSLAIMKNGDNKFLGSSTLSVVNGSVPTFNQHLLVPIAAGPRGTTTVGVTMNGLSDVWTLNDSYTSSGCKLDVLSQ
jgi:hypothetical protein